MPQGLVPQSGTVGDATDCSLKTAIGLFEIEYNRCGSTFPFLKPRTVAELEDTVAAWVHRYSTDRPLRGLGLIPPLECGADYYAAERATKLASTLATECASDSE
jgi:hypothetical protein